MILEDELAAIIARQRELEGKKSIGQMRSLDFNKVLLDSHVLDITGVRRCGKSTVMRQRMRGTDQSRRKKDALHQTSQSVSVFVQRVP